MPNWCTNEVSIYGHKNEEQLKQFVDECITGGVIDFEKVMPYPDSAPSRDDLYIADDEVQLTFDTAWGPPSGIYQELVNKYPDLHFSWFYKEEGMQVAGWLPE